MKINNAKNQEVEQEYFIRMMMPKIQELAFPFEKEEKKELKYLLESRKDINKMNLSVIGAGTLFYVEIALKFKLKYTAIEPLINIFLQKQVNFLIKKYKNIKIIGEKFGSFNKSKLSNNNQIFAFIFNVLGYIKNPIEKINKYIKTGDIIFISSWNNNNKESKVIKESYFDALNNSNNKYSNIIYNKETIGICNLDNFPFEKLKYYKKHKRIKGKITDILIIYC